VVVFRTECRRVLLSYLALLWIAITVAGAGCKSPIYRVADLPLEYSAPPPLNLETLNVGGLAGSSVSCEVIQPGDVLEVAMVTDFTKLGTTTTAVRVAEDGTIFVPLIGRIRIAGFDAEQAERIIAGESILRGVFRNPCVTVTMKQCRTRRITVVGAVNKPGTVELPRGSSSLLEALVAAEGLSDEAGAEVEIRRTDVRNLAHREPPREVTPSSYQESEPAPTMPLDVVKVDLTTAAGGINPLPELRDGDVVYVPKRALKPVYVLGLVHKPGEIPFPKNQELRLLDAIAVAGGYSNPLVEKILVVRQPPGMAEPIRIAINTQAAKQGEENLALAPGDIVSVENTPLTAVTDLFHNLFHVGIGATMPLF
jgi:polysaccharide export outer membrane protein